MTGFSGFCIALSAAALLAGALPGQAQSQRPTGLRIMDVASGRDGDSFTRIRRTINTRLDLFRPAESADALLGRRKIRMLLNVTITGNEGTNVTFTDIGVRGNGVYRGRLENGVRVSGTLSGFGSAAFSDPDAETYLSGTYTLPRGDNTIEVPYETDREVGGWREILRQMLYMESQYESARYGGSTERLEARNPIISSSAGHITRGRNIVGRDASNISTDFRFYVDGVDITGGENPGCVGTFNCAVVALPQNAGIYQVTSRGDFTAYFVDDVDVVQSHRGIRLVLDRTENSNAANSHVSFGAWMDDAGFFVATGTKGEFDNSNGTFQLRSIQEVFVRGEPTGSRPDARANWLGSMVGTVLAGENKDNLLRGGVRLWFNPRRSKLGAEFFNIRDYDRFGAKHIMKEVETGPRNRLRFRKIPVAADGSYARTYSEDEGGGGIRGAFYGSGQAETAGTFDRYGIVAAFGAKKLTN